MLPIGEFSLESTWVMSRGSAKSNCHCNCQWNLAYRPVDNWLGRKVSPARTGWEEAKYRSASPALSAACDAVMLAQDIAACPRREGNAASAQVFCLLMVMFLFFRCLRGKMGLIACSSRHSAPAKAGRHIQPPRSGERDKHHQYQERVCQHTIAIHSTPSIP